MHLQVADLDALAEVARRRLAMRAPAGDSPEARELVAAICEHARLAHGRAAWMLPVTGGMIVADGPVRSERKAATAGHAGDTAFGWQQRRVLLAHEAGEWRTCELTDDPAGPWTAVIAAHLPEVRGADVGALHRLLCAQGAGRALPPR